MEPPESTVVPAPLRFSALPVVLMSPPAFDWTNSRPVGGTASSSDSSTVARKFSEKVASPFSASGDAALSAHGFEHLGRAKIALVSKRQRLADKAGIDMPEVGVWDSPEINAFCTGPTKNSSLVAVSTGLLQQMQRNEVDAVLGHEIAHVANGDMVTLTLIQGVVNTFVIVISRIAVTMCFDSGVACAALSVFAARRSLLHSSEMGLLAIDLCQ